MKSFGETDLRAKALRCSLLSSACYAEKCIACAPFLLLWKTKSVNGHNAPIKKKYNATYSAMNCLQNVIKISPQRKTWRKRALLLVHALFREEIKRIGS